MSDLVVKISADISRLDAGIREAENRVSSFGDVLKGSFLGGIGANIATSAFGTLTGAVTDAFHALAEVDKISGQTAAVIKSTGGAAGVTADQIAALADSLERKTGIEAESIQRGQNLLLTFTNIKDAAGAGNDIFTQTTKIMADLGTAMGTDASSAAIQLGKALNDPTQGITALTRVGVTFTDAQKEQIKALQASGDMMGAQRIILAELRKEFGGSADALGKTFGGALERAKNGLGSISEAMLQSNVPLFTAALSKAADAAYAVSDAITKGDIAGLINRAFGPGAKALITGLSVALGVQMVGSMRTVAAQAVTMGQAYARAAAAMVIANAPVVAAIAAISFAAYPFIKNWDGVKDLFSTIWQTMKNAVSVSMKFIGDVSRNAWQTISGHFRSAYTNFKAFFIGPVASAFGALFDALPQKLKDTLGGFTMPKITFDIPGVGAAFQEVKSIASDALDTVTGGLMIAKEQFTETWKDFPGEISGVMNGFTSSITGASQAAVAGLKPVNAALDKLGGDAKEAHEKAGKAADSHAKSVKTLESPYVEFAKALSMVVPYARELKRQIFEARWSKISREIAEYIATVNKMEQPFKDAKKQLEDMDKVSKYWADTTDKTAEKMGILRSAINSMIANGVDPASDKVKELREEYEKLGKVPPMPPPPPMPMDSIKEVVGALGEISNGINKILEPFGVQIPSFVSTAITTMIGLVAGIAAVTTAVGVLGGALAALNAHPIMLAITLATAAGLALYGFLQGQDEAAKKQLKAWDDAANQQYAYEKQIRQTNRTLQDSSRDAIKAYEQKGAVVRDLNADELLQVRSLYDDYTAAQQAIIDSAWKSSDERKRAEEEFATVAEQLNKTWPAAVASALKNGDTEFVKYFEQLGLIARESTQDIANDIGNNLRSGLISAMRTAGKEFLSGNLEWMQRLRDGIKETVIGGVIDALIQRAAIDKLMPEIDKLASRLAAGERGGGINDAIKGIFAQADSIGGVITGALSGIKTAFDEFSPKVFNEAYRPIIANANKMMTDALSAGNTEQVGRASLIFQEAQANAYTAGSPVTIAYYGNGKWTREDAEKLGALIVSQVKSAGVR